MATAVLGLNLARYRRAAALTQEQLAERASVRVDTIRKLEQGQRRDARLSTLRRLADALAVDVADLLGPIGRRPDRATAGHLAALEHDLRVADDTSPTGSLLGAARRLAGLAEEMAATAPEREAPAIGRAAVGTALLLWWLTVDSGLDARRPAERVIALAHEWQVPAAIGFLSAWRVDHALGAGDLAAAQRFADIARRPGWHLTPGAEAWVMNHVARVALATDRHDEARHAAAEAVDAYDRVEPSAEPGWLYWLDGPILDLDRAEATLVSDGPDAAPVLLDALDRLPADRLRDRSWYRARLAAARARAGDVQGAAVDAAEAAAAARATNTPWPVAELSRLASAPHLAPLRTALDHNGFARRRCLLGVRDGGAPSGEVSGEPGARLRACVATSPFSGGSSPRPRPRRSRPPPASTCAR